jgi:hypothetical protein
LVHGPPESDYLEELDGYGLPCDAIGHPKCGIIVSAGESHGAATWAREREWEERARSWWRRYAEEAAPMNIPREDPEIALALLVETKLDYARLRRSRIRDISAALRVVAPARSRRSSGVKPYMLKNVRVGSTP